MVTPPEKSTPDRPLLIPGITRRSRAKSGSLSESSARGPRRAVACAAGPARGVVRAAGPPGGWGPQARGELPEKPRRPRRAYKLRRARDDDHRPRGGCRCGGIRRSDSIYAADARLLRRARLRYAVSLGSL